MYRIIPFIIFLSAICYLFYSPAPIDKIEKIVKTRDCYKLRLMDQERINLSTNKTIPIDRSTASIKKNNSSEDRLIKEEQRQNNFSLALSHTAK